METQRCGTSTALSHSAWETVQSKSLVGIPGKIRVDFLGAAGAGKSTLYKRVLTGGRRRQWLTESEAYRSAIERYAKQVKSRPKGMLLKIPVVGDAYAHRIERIAINRAFQPYAEAHEAFLRIAADNFAQSNRSEYRRAEGYYNFIKTLRMWAFVEQFMPTRPVLSDESLSQKVYGILPKDCENVGVARNYFDEMPLPAAMVHITGDLGTIVTQIRDRQQQTGRLIPAHQDIGDEELAKRTASALSVATVGAETLLKRGVPVLTLQAGERLDDMVGDVREFLSALSHPTK